MKYILLGAAVAIGVGSVIFFNRPSGTGDDTLVYHTENSPTPSPAIEQPTNITASFTIKTGNITRIFKAEKYHNQSEDVYIEASDPTVVHVKKQGITWADFFNTLSMKLTKDCLTTGDGETFCNNQGGTLKFYLNDLEDPDLLQKPIRQGDKALIIFSS